MRLNTSAATIRMRLALFSLPRPGCWPLPVPVPPLYALRSFCETAHNLTLPLPVTLYWTSHSEASWTMLSWADCGPSLSPAFHLWNRPCSTPKMAARRPQVSTFLRLQSKHAPFLVWLACPLSPISEYSAEREEATFLSLPRVMSCIQTDYSSSWYRLFIYEIQSPSTYTSDPHTVSGSHIAPRKPIGALGVL